MLRLPLDVLHLIVDELDCYLDRRNLARTCRHLSRVRGKCAADSKARLNQFSEKLKSKKRYALSEILNSKEKSHILTEIACHRYLPLLDSATALLLDDHGHKDAKNGEMPLIIRQTMFQHSERCAVYESFLGARNALSTSERLELDRSFSSTPKWPRLQALVADVATQLAWTPRQDLPVFLPAVRWETLLNELSSPRSDQSFFASPQFQELMVEMPNIQAMDDDAKTAFVKKFMCAFFCANPSAGQSVLSILHHAKMWNISLDVDKLKGGNFWLLCKLDIELSDKICQMVRQLLGDEVCENHFSA